MPVFDETGWSTDDVLLCDPVAKEVEMALVAARGILSTLPSAVSSSSDSGGRAKGQVIHSLRESPASLALAAASLSLSQTDATMSRASDESFFLPVPGAEARLDCNASHLALFTSLTSLRPRCQDGTRICVIPSRYIDTTRCATAQGY